MTEDRRWVQRQGCFVGSDTRKRSEGGLQHLAQFSMLRGSWLGVPDSEAGGAGGVWVG